MGEPHFFGIRHLSPAGAYYLREYLDEIKPKAVLVECPDDFADVLVDITRKETVPPIAILAYTQSAPVHTILYPFAEYSPEYQAVKWCKEHKAECRFIDLPSEGFLGLYEKRLKEEEEEGEIDDSGESSYEENSPNVFERLDVVSGEDGHETFWERTLEHAADKNGYHKGVNLFGAEIRALDKKGENEETLLREAHMRHNIRLAAEKYGEESVVVVTGSYHVEGLKAWREQDAFPEIPRVAVLHTLMPYSYYRLSSRSGYGAGNKAPAYYELIWDALNCKEPRRAAYSYLSMIAEYNRKHGSHVSSAEVIEAVRLADSLAVLRGGKIPVLRDLRDAAMTCLGGGSFAGVSVAAADIEIGTKIGALPEGVSRTSIQDDFYRQMSVLKLEKYRSAVAEDLKLDLREDRRAATEKAAFLDLNRSFFLHRLRVLGMGFAQKREVSQESATWAELWTLYWTPEAEISLVESALKGDTVELAAAFVFKERIDAAGGMSAVAEVIEDAFCCGMPSALSDAARALQGFAVDAASFEELANTARRLSTVIRYGDIRHIDSSGLVPILKQLYYRACLICPNQCGCDDDASKVIISAMNSLNEVALAHDFFDGNMWLDTLKEIARRDDLNTKISGFAAAVLLERGEMDSAELKLEVGRRLSLGVPADLGAGWFEGLTLKNRYALIARLSLWESLDDYLKQLSDDEFKRALVFLRRAFADFSAKEKDEIAENLGEIWGLNAAEVSETLNSELDEASKDVIEGLDDFDFDI